MLHRIWNWLRELKTEAPWYFWAYVALTPLGLLVIDQDSMRIGATAALVMYIFLLKTFGLLRSSSVYIFSLTAYFLMDGYIIEYIWGKSQTYYLISMHGTVLYPKIYDFGIASACAAPLAAIAALIHKQSLAYALKVCITAFFMLVAGISGFLLLLLPFSPC